MKTVFGWKVVYYIRNGKQYRKSIKINNIP